MLHHVIMYYIILYYIILYHILLCEPNDRRIDRRMELEKDTRKIKVDTVYYIYHADTIPIRVGTVYYKRVTRQIQVVYIIIVYDVIIIYDM